MTPAPRTVTYLSQQSRWNRPPLSERSVLAVAALNPPQSLPEEPGSMHRLHQLAGSDLLRQRQQHRTDLLVGAKAGQRSGGPHQQGLSEVATLGASSGSLPLARRLSPIW